MKAQITTRFMFSLLFVALLMACSHQATRQSVDLKGNWRFSMDSVALADSVILPGSMNSNGKGKRIAADTKWTGSMWNRAWYENEEYCRYRQNDSTKVVFWLQPNYYYVGEAWYEREVEIAHDWSDKAVVISFERSHWETTLWVDGNEIGKSNSLNTPHRYVLEGLSKGKHTLRLRVDNRIKEINPGVDAHSISDNTQSNWNGIVGTMIIEARPKVYVESVRLVADATSGKVNAEVSIVNMLKKQVKGRIWMNIPSLGRISELISLQNEQESCSIELSTENYVLWSEFTPNVYKAYVSLETAAGIDVVEESFGFRHIITEGTQIVLNGRPLFLRGTLECCIFPKTGFPPTDEAEWEYIMMQCKKFGLNHIRFHSWCPPKAAFNVADRLGIYLQVECGFWANTIGEGKALDKYIYDESERIVKEYGNHPSFALFAYGNEPSGPRYKEYLVDFVKHWKQKENRFLVTTAAGWPAAPETDYDNLPEPRIQQWGEGVNSMINAKVASTNYDWRERISKQKPTISHEIGQWCVYPNLKERAKYTGCFKANNFDIFEDRLRESGLLLLADSFLLASGKLQTLCYKADIEAALRTPGFGGFQLLDLHDFPGQGTALVGVLDPFWDEKPYCTASDYRQFCNDVVPLMRTDKLIYQSGEQMQFSIEVAQYGPLSIPHAKVVYKLLGADEKVIVQGNYDCDLPTGTIVKVADVKLDMKSDSAVQYKLLVEVGKQYLNSWNLWVYPSEQPVAEGVKVVNKLDAGIEHFLIDGGKVLLTPSFGTLRNEGGDSCIVGFSSIFWNTLWTRNQAPHTLGILCNPYHPALKNFPTNYYTDYQWRDLMAHCNVIPLHRLADHSIPIVRIIDDWFTARSFGMIAEYRVGKGKLIVSGVDLLTNNETRPEARQMLSSLTQYMVSDAFLPQTETTLLKVKGLFKK